MENDLTKKKTLIVGVSQNTSRYAYSATEMLQEHKVPFVPIGINKGEVFGKKIKNLREKPEISNVHTVTLYINPEHQKEWEDYLISLKPKRLFFNPGAENQAFAEKARKENIEVKNACTMVMLSTDQF
ncbi:CoA-binding protein [Echinicola jeungdonensis]|uniref:CoA-binding protein n=1 Tax=Echinicola jeungdonensis TaxID=709343 RepID=UPI0025B2DCB1|nr:CoA-binding protein [Echinicola jeungdonensis]MDN3671215.1 CoA-binding protein [Echinicola jeungdonensis]